MPKAIYITGNLLYSIQQLKTLQIGTLILKIHPQKVEVWNQEHVFNENYILLKERNLLDNPWCRNTMGTTFMVTIVFLSQLSMDEFLKFKWQFVMLWAAEYSRVGLHYCRWPWARGPNATWTKCHVDQMPRGKGTWFHISAVCGWIFKILKPTCHALSCRIQ